MDKEVNQESNVLVKEMESGDYNPIPLYRLISMSDLVVIGTITFVKDSTFVIQTSEFLVGDSISGQIRIKKYIPSAFFAPRPIPYGKGQRFTFFLRESNRQDTHKIFNILGYAGEGEIPVDEEYVYVGNSHLEVLEKKIYQVHGVQRELRRFGLQEFKDAVKNYGNCLSWNLETYIKNNKERERWVASNTCDEKTLEEYRSKSRLHEYLVKETLNKIQKGE